MPTWKFLYPQERIGGIVEYLLRAARYNKKCGTESKLRNKGGDDIRKELIIVIVFIIISTMVTGCGKKEANAKVADNGTTAEESQQEANKDYVAYENAQYNIKLLYPKNWEVKENVPGLVVSFSSPRENANDMYRETIGITVCDLNQSVKLKEYVEQAISKIKQQITNVNVISRENSSISNNKAEKIVYTGQNAQGENIKWAQWITIQNKKLYVITLAAEENKYNSAVDYAEYLVKTMKIR